MKDAHELRFYTTEQACELLNLGRTYLYYCRMAGVLQYTRIGKRKILYTEEQLAAFKQMLVEDAPRVHRLIQKLLRSSKKRR
jgi:excisionase family DNA binding protein